MPTAAIREGLSYLRSHPLFLVTAARNAARLGVSVPIDLLRWAIDRRPRGKGPERIDIASAPPGFALGLTVDLYGTKIDISAHLGIESVEIEPESLRLGLRVRELKVVAPPGSPAAMLMGSLDLSNPGNLVKMMPQKHNALVDVKDDLFIIDLMKIKKLATNRSLRRVLAALSGVLSIREVRTDDDVMMIGLRVNPIALPGALARIRAA